MTTTKKEWRKPEVKKIAAGSAESGSALGDDANTTNTKS